MSRRIIGAVRRGTGNPLDALVGSGLFKALWLSDRGVTASSGMVSGWADQSGHGYNVASANAGLRPQLKTGGVNGQPYLESAGGQGLWLPSFDLSATQDVTVFAAVEYTGSGTGIICELTTDTNSATDGFGLYVDPANALAGGTLIGDVGYSLSNIPFTAGILRAQFYKSLATNESQLFAGGSNAGSSNPLNYDNTNSFANAGLYLMSRGNSGLFSQMRLYALGLVDRKTTAAENSFVESCLAQAYPL